MLSPDEEMLASCRELPSSSDPVPGAAENVVASADDAAATDLDAGATDNDAGATVNNPAATEDGGAWAALHDPWTNDDVDASDEFEASSSVHGLATGTNTPCAGQYVGASKKNHVSTRKN
jgi:hypothetical protein